MKNKVAISVAVGILGAAGVMSSAQAVHVNPDGTGQVLLFPYYNAQDGYVTNINLVNSTDQTKAVKIRFREGKNSQDVLDFNLYMSPEDVWTGSVKGGVNGAGEPVGSISTNDRSCTLPTLIDCKAGECGGKQQPFTGIDVAPADTREGYVEVIEMGVVDDADVQKGVKHSNGTPADCGTLKTAWGKTGNFTKGSGVSAPTGGLFGSSAVINVGEGSAFAVDPVAIDNYSTKPQHYRADDVNNYLLPSLASGDVTKSSVIVNNGAGAQMVVTDWKPTTADSCKDTINPACGSNPYPIAHVLLAPHLMNEYFLDTSFGYDGHTDWVVTLPMKKHNIHAKATDIVATFENGIFDREEGRPTSVPASESDDFGFSPPAGGKPTEVDASSRLLREVNVLSFKSSVDGYDDSRSVLSSPNAQDISVGGFAHGWARVSFPNYDLSPNVNGAGKGYGAAGSVDYAASSSIYKGVPALGAAFIEGNVSENEHARFGDALPHKIQRD